jgi:hypothetical protein
MGYLLGFMKFNVYSTIYVLFGSHICNANDNRYVKPYLVKSNRSKLLEIDIVIFKLVITDDN